MNFNIFLKLDLSFRASTLADSHKIAYVRIWTHRRAMDACFLESHYKCGYRRIWKVNPLVPVNWKERPCVALRAQWPRGFPFLLTHRLHQQSDAFGHLQYPTSGACRDFFWRSVFSWFPSRGFVNITFAIFDTLIRWQKLACLIAGLKSGLAKCRPGDEQ